MEEAIRGRSLPIRLEQVSLYHFGDQMCDVGGVEVPSEAFGGKLLTFRRGGMLPDSPPPHTLPAMPPNAPAPSTTPEASPILPCSHPGLVSTLPAPHLTHGPVWIPMRMSAWEPSWGIRTCSGGRPEAWR